MKPLRDIVFVRRAEPEEKERGIIIPHQSRKKMTRAEVVAVGPQVKEVEVGNMVHVHTHIGEKHTYDGIEFYALHSNEIEAVEV